MTNQKRGAAKVFHAVRKKGGLPPKTRWPQHADLVGGAPPDRGEPRPERPARAFGDSERAHFSSEKARRHGIAMRDERGRSAREGALRDEAGVRPESQGRADRGDRHDRKSDRPERGLSRGEMKSRVERSDRPDRHVRANPNARNLQDAREERQSSQRAASARRGAAREFDEPTAPAPRLPPGARPLNSCVPAFQALRAQALKYPNSYEDHADGLTLVKLRNKNVIVALGREGGGLTVACKLPRTGLKVISTFSWATPAGYGMGRKGWVQARFSAGDKLPLRMLLGWLEESHQAAAAKVPPPPPLR